MTNRKVIGLLLIGITLIIGGIFFFMLIKGQEKKSEDKTTVSQQPKLKDIPNSTVRLSSSGFEPKSIEIDKDTRVVWINASGEKASVNSNDHPTHAKYFPLNLGEFANDSSVQFIFDKAGTYEYHNHLKPQQTGTITVK